MHEKKNKNHLQKAPAKGTKLRVCADRTGKGRCLQTDLQSPRSKEAEIKIAEKTNKTEQGQCLPKYLQS